MSTSASLGVGCGAYSSGKPGRAHARTLGTSRSALAAASNHRASGGRTPSHRRRHSLDHTDWFSLVRPPERLGPWQTAASRYQLWRQEGRWARSLQVLQKAEVPLLSST